MEIFEQWRGTLPGGYIGNITYSTELPETIDQMKIILEYQEPQEAVLQPSMLQNIKQAFDLYPHPDCIKPDFRNKVIDSMKTEIQLCAMLNDEFLGNIHKPGTCKEMLIHKNSSSYGCLPVESIHGNLKITINCFQVLYDSTTYTLKVLVEP